LNESETLRIDEVDHAQADARDFIAICRANAAFGGADFIFAFEHFAL
jgi:hypothetical protein